MTLNEILHKLYSINSEIENLSDPMLPWEDLHTLINFFEKQLPYKQDSAYELNPKHDMTLLFQETLPRGIGQ